MAAVGGRRMQRRRKRRRRSKRITTRRKSRRKRTRRRIAAVTGTRTVTRQPKTRWKSQLKQEAVNTYVDGFSQMNYISFGFPTA